MILAGTVAPPALADHTPDPDTVTLVGSLQSELGCSGDWMPGCSVTNLSSDVGNGDWRGSFDIPAGNWAFKVAINASFLPKTTAPAGRKVARISASTWPNRPPSLSSTTMPPM